MDIDTTHHKHTNNLIKETSPYLLQHAHNPVNWHAWSDETLELAKKENKLLLISIGYSACHWCHVMEHESFENEEVAKIMNDNFICIKVDREERPDIDQIYMNAVQLMTGRGGWPLNCFALPTGEPFYGGTYFQKNQWMQILNNVANEYKVAPEKVNEYAQKLTAGIKTSEMLPMVKDETPFSMDVLTAGVTRIKKQFDYVEGGGNHAPKFPMPNNYEFLLQYYYHTKDQEILDIVELTLDKMAFGGIYDQIGGGFARYSTDKYWKAPHFEKMLYDNGQLVSLYSQAYQLTKKPLYKHVVYQTLEYSAREMTAKNGAFYSALDADSEGEEGKFYVWNKEELQTILKNDFEFAKEYYNVNATGKWEGHYILLRKKNNTKIAKQFNISKEDVEKKINKINTALLKERAKRIRPGLDDKTLTSWNALMLKGYVDAYNVFGEEKFLKAAIKNAEFIVGTQIRKDGGLNHNYKNGISNLDGYLEDYSFTTEALIALYQATFDEKWLTHAKQLTDYTIEHFYDANTGFFFFTSKNAKGLIARKMELSDNVIPASNSSMAKALFLLGELYYDKNYTNKSKQMLKNIEAQIPQYISGYSNWGILMLNNVKPFYEIAISGKKAHQQRQEFNKNYVPNKLIIGSVKESSLPLLEMKLTNGKTLIYVCYDKVCQKPVEKVSEALLQIK
ncbi:MAG: thioredoxin domain-containing protein [Flavobacteriales bacterium]|nr:thioredoxin domain-containing protein [Flavobacteriales bacterium]